MRLQRNHAKRTILVPGALAVVSFALALLAAQPAVGTVGTSVPKHRAAVMVAASGAGHEMVSGRGEKTVVGSVGQRAVVATQTFFAEARRLRVLATVEILQRLLVAELGWGEVGQQQMLAPVLFFEPVCVEVLDAPLMVACGAEAVEQLDTPLPERQFAIEHCQLAPPIV